VGKLVRDYKALKAQKEVLETLCSDLQKRCKAYEEKVTRTQQTLTDLLQFLNAKSSSSSSTS